MIERMRRVTTFKRKVVRIGNEVVLDVSNVRWSSREL
jgi:hypothetical protein